MEQYTIDLIKAAFKRCWGLQDLITNKTYLVELAAQTCLNLNYLQKHYEQIKQL